MKKILFLVLTMFCFSVVELKAHVFQIRVNQAQDGSLTWFLISYHAATECPNSDAGININGTNYPISNIVSGDGRLQSPNVFADDPGCYQRINPGFVVPANLYVSYAVVHTPYIAGTLNVNPYSNANCFAFCVGGQGSFNPPPPPPCTSCPITSWSNTVALPGTDNNTPCDQTDDYTTATIKVNTLACAKVTGDGKFTVVFDPGGTNVLYGPFNYATGTETSVNINIPYGTSNSTQVAIVDDDFPCYVEHGLSIPGGIFLGIRETTPPNITCPQPINVQCADDVPDADPNSVVASDNCGTTRVTWEGDVITDQTCRNRYTITRTYKAIDPSGNSSTCTQTITVADNTAPVAPAPPADANYQCKADVPAAGTLTAKDNCSGPITVIGSDASNGGSGCPNDPLIITRTWTFTDECGNTSSVSQTIIVVDNTAPVAPAPPADANYQCKADVPVAGTLTAKDNCSGPITVIGSDASNGGSGCPNDPLIITRTWTFTDACGNTSNVSQTIKVVDNTPPVLVCPPNQTVAPTTLAGTVVTYTAPSATDNCGVVSVTQTAGKTSGSTFPIGTTTNTFVAKDACGNTATCSFTVTVKDPYCDKSPNNQKVYVCHNGKTICVSVNALQSHMNHGDYLGSCTNGNRTAKPEMIVSTTDGINVYPNPNNGLFDVQLTGLKPSKATIVILNGNGSILEKRSIEGTLKKQLLSFDMSRYSSGLYYIQIITPEGIKFDKVTIQR